MKIIHYLLNNINISLLVVLMDWDSSVGIATRYGLEGPGIECRVPVQTGPGVHPASYTMGIGSCLGRAVDHPSHLAPRLNKTFAACSRVNFTVYLFLHFRFSCVKLFRYHQMVFHYTLLFFKYRVQH